MRSDWRTNKTYDVIQTEKLQSALEKVLAGLYKDASAELAVTVRDYFNSFAGRDAEMKAQVAAGIFTEEYYKLWRMNNIGRGERWQTMLEQMTERLKNVDVQAAAYINNSLPAIYALNHDYTLYSVKSLAAEGAVFTLTNERAVRELILGGDHVTFRTVNPNPVRDYIWNQQRIQRTLTVDIMQGKSIDKIAVDFLHIQRGNLKAAIRNARTATTSAAGAAKQSAMEEAKAMGIKFKKMWSAANDDRTRNSHRLLDGESVDTDESFIAINHNGSTCALRYPCDPLADPEQVYNCRCVILSVPEEHDEFMKMTPNDFEDWRAELSSQMEFEIVGD